MNYKYLFLVLWIYFLALPTQALGSQESDVKKIFDDINLNKIDNIELRKKLTYSASIGSCFAKSVSIFNDKIHVIYVRKTATTLTLQTRKSILNALAMQEVLKFQALNIESIRDALSKFTYADLLIRYTGNKLVSRVFGNFDTQMKRSVYFEYPRHFAILLVIPNKAIEITTVNIISEKETTNFYVVSLIKESKKLFSEKRYEETAKMIFEIRKFSSISKNSFMDLYACYLHTGNIEQAKQVLSLLSKSYHGSMGLDDYFRIAEIAEDCNSPSIATNYYLKIDRLLNKPVSIDSFLVEDSFEKE